MAEACGNRTHPGADTTSATVLKTEEITRPRALPSTDSSRGEESRTLMASILLGETGRRPSCHLDPCNGLHPNQGPSEGGVTCSFASPKPELARLFGECRYLQGMDGLVGEEVPQWRIDHLVLFDPALSGSSAESVGQEETQQRREEGPDGGSAALGRALRGLGSTWRARATSPGTVPRKVGAKVRP